MAVNTFRPRKFEDHEIVNGRKKVVGHIRVKPSGVLWAPANSKKWFGMSLERFSTFMQKQGKLQRKSH